MRVYYFKDTHVRVSASFPLCSTQKQREKCYLLEKKRTNGIIFWAQSSGILGGADTVVIAQTRLTCASVCVYLTPNAALPRPAFSPLL